MILCTFISVGLKYGYDNSSNDILMDYQTRYIDFSKLYVFHETIFIFDAIIIFMMAISIIKYTFFWIPSLSLITESFRSYFNETIKKIICFVLALGITFSVYIHFISSFYAYGFFNYLYSIIRTNMLFIQGNLFIVKKVYL